jgi:transcriptional regulator with XRE-family HTH domain
MVYTHFHFQRPLATSSQKLQREAGNWLRQLRESRGLSQRELAKIVDAEYYTLISQLEHGRGRIPPDRYLLWADALGVEPHEFIRELISYYGVRRRRARVPHRSVDREGPLFPRSIVDDLKDAEELSSRQGVRTRRLRTRQFSAGRRFDN